MKTNTLALAAFAAAVSIAHAEEKIILTQFDLSDTASDRGQARVGHFDDADVRFDRRKWIVRRFDTAVCYRVK